MINATTGFWYPSSLHFSASQPFALGSFEINFRFKIFPVATGAEADFSLLRNHSRSKKKEGRKAKPAFFKKKRKRAKEEKPELRL